MLKKIFLAIILVMAASNLCFGIYIDVIPLMYLLLLMIGYGVLGALVCLMFKFKKRIFSLLGVILGVIIITLAMVVDYAFLKWNHLLDSVTNVDTEIYSYSVLVLDEADYEELSDIEGTEIGILEEKDENYEKAISTLSDEIEINEKEYDNALLMVNDLLSNDVEVIFLSDGYLSIFEEELDDFEGKVRVLYTVEVETEVVSETTSSDSIDTVNESFNIYISGIDTYGAISTVSRSDVNIIVTINPNTNKILLTSVPRDMYVSLAGKTGLKDKLTHAGVYGINTSVETLENFLDIDISYYVRINFTTLVSLVDYLGGIDVESDYSFSAGGRTFVVGTNYNLTGAEALAFSRNRYAFSDGDRQRGRNQEKVLTAIINKVTESNDINTYLNLINVMENSFQTNMDKDTINKFVEQQIKYNYNWEITSNDVNGSDSMDYTYSYPWQKLYVMLVNEDSLEKAKSLINSVMNGE